MIQKGSNQVLLRRVRPPESSGLMKFPMATKLLAVFLCDPKIGATLSGSTSRKKEGENSRRCLRILVLREQLIVLERWPEPFKVLLHAQLLQVLLQLRRALRSCAHGRSSRRQARARFDATTKSLQFVTLICVKRAPFTPASWKERCGAHSLRKAFFLLHAGPHLTTGGCSGG